MTSLEKLQHLQKTLPKWLGKFNIVPQRKEIFEMAFTHRSFINEYADKRILHNERLEFLGDAVLELCITELLYQRHPEKSEGEMTDIRSSCVRGKNLAHIASQLGIGELILLSSGEERAYGRENTTILADAFEALLGAIHMDLGIDAARTFIETYIYSSLEKLLEERAHLDPKSLLQELIQGKTKSLPRYVLVSEIGADHEKIFTMDVFFGEIKIGTGTGQSKKRAQESAAQNALDHKPIWEKMIH